MSEKNNLVVPGDGAMLIGNEWVRGTGSQVWSQDAETGENLSPSFNGGGEKEIDTACALAESIFDEYRGTSSEDRAVFLETIASEIEALGDTLTVRVMSESGLPRGRVEGETGRTATQLRMFANVLRAGDWAGIRHDPELPERQPMRRPDLKLRNIAIGPVAVFGASNFPLAFSVAGGDTASALAAGCPVIVKAHGAHLGTSALVASAIERARASSGMPVGVFSLLVGADNDFGAALVSDPRIKAVGFTGSRAGGTALMRLAAERPEPIPVYAEMSSINPVILMPNALEKRGREIAQSFAGSLTLGVGQFCTNPGLIFARKGKALESFIETAASELQKIEAASMLTPSIHATYEKAAEARAEKCNVKALNPESDKPFAAQSYLYRCDAEQFLTDESLSQEIFGPAALIVEYEGVGALPQLLEFIEGQLTIALHIDEADYANASMLMPVLERKAGRLLVNGFGTGVEVADSMVHGGPWPATSDSRTTSVGSLAIFRFLRPVCYQDMPDSLLPRDLIE